MEAVVSPNPSGRYLRGAVFGRRDVQDSEPEWKAAAGKHYEHKGKHHLPAQWSLIWYSYRTGIC
ncbi:MAG: hypothetical protein OXH57_09770 [Ekhidna sp.]|nr:hypothetical protein [Ekhidna sp.]